MTDTTADIARAAAARLEPELGAQLGQDVEAAIHAQEGSAPERYVLDPVSLAGLIVSVASFAWTVYRDLKKETPEPSRDVVARTVRVRLEDPGSHSAAERDRVIEVVVDETIKQAEG